MLTVLAGACVAAALVVAAALKLADRTGAAVALTTYGIRGDTGRAALAALVAWELALAAGLLAGVTVLGWAAAATLGLFAVVQAVLVAAGRGGLPCGCLGARGRLSLPGAARTAALAGLAAVAAAGGAQPIAEEPVVALLAAVVAALAVVALRPRRPDAALEVAAEGPEVGARTGLADWLPAPAGDELRLAVFTSARCRICRELGPAMARLVEEDDVVLRTYEAERDREVWAATDVPGAPFAVVVDPGGRVVAKGTVNTGPQLASVVAVARERRAALVSSGEASLTSRRTVLVRAATVAGSVAAATSVGSLARPSAAQAYHFCGHVYTTDGCPHPTGLPRIDSKGRPLRASDGARVDDLGRPIDPDGFPLADDGARLTDTDGRPLPPAPRSRVCDVVARRFSLRTQIDGAWYRCCDGRVRKLIDCCTPTGTRRINGDRALEGYCHEGRRVFCVLYYDTSVRC